MSWWHHKWWPMMAGVDVENGTGHVAATLVVAASFAWEDDWAAGVVVRRLLTTWRCEVARVGDRSYWTEWERESGSYGLEREMVDRPRDKKKRKRKELLIWGWFEKIARVFLREFFPPDLLFFCFRFSPLCLLYMCIFIVEKAALRLPMACSQGLLPLHCPVMDALFRRRACTVQVIEQCTLAI